MTKRTLLTAAEARTLTNAANASGCAIVLKRGDDTITFIPDGHSLQSKIHDTPDDGQFRTLEEWKIWRDKQR